VERIKRGGGGLAAEAKIRLHEKKKKWMNINQFKWFVEKD